MRSNILKFNYSKKGLLLAAVVIVPIVIYLFKSYSPPEMEQVIDITSEFVTKPEEERLRYFREIGMQGIRSTYGLTGNMVKIAIMGEAIDSTHPDLKGRVHNQYDTYPKSSHVLIGHKNLPYGFDTLSFGDGHGTHIAGIVAANCDGVGLQGIACNSILNAYSFGGYKDVQLLDQGKYIIALSRALDHITEVDNIKITTGSFNIESPAIEYKNIQLPQGLSMKVILERIVENSNGLDDMIQQGIAIFKIPSDIEYIKSFEAQLDKKAYTAFVLSSLLPFSKEWQQLEESIRRYQESGGVYIITESNTVLNRTSILNAMPSISDKVDKDLWISAVMVEPKDLEKAMSKRELENLLDSSAYITPLNNCGELAYGYCILTPSYDILSTMTAKVKYADLPLFIIEGRSYQPASGHSMGAPMIAAALALMQEYNQREGLGYSMKDLVRILKKSANRSFKGYDPKKHGQGVLDIKNALEMMK